MIQDPKAVFFVLAAVVAIAVGLEGRFRLAKALGSALVAILMGMLLSNAGVIPGESVAYQFLVGTGVQAGIVLILLSVDVRSVVQAGPTMLAAFGLGALGTAIGATVGGFLLADLVGPETWKLAGQYAGTYTGGGVNFAAVGTALGTSSDLFSAGIAADVIVTAMWMATCLTVPALLGSNSRGPQGGGKTTDATEADTPRTPGDDAAGAVASAPRTPKGLAQRLFRSRDVVSMRDLSILAALTFGAVWGADLIGSWTQPVPSILWLTTIAILLAQVPAVRGLSGAAVVGNYLVLLFLASNGARSVVANIIEVGPPVFYFALTTIAIHGIVIFGLGRLVGIDAGTLAVASQANVGGPGSAIALAGARGYGEKILPGVAVGLMGYALGNYVGILLGQAMRLMLGT